MKRISLTYAIAMGVFLIVHREHHLRSRGRG